MGTLLRLLIAGAALTVVYIALREPDAPPRSRRLRERGGPADETEPVLGYDGMDLETLLPWLESAELDDDTLERVRAYEQRHRAREAVLDTLDDLLG